MVNKTQYIIQELLERNLISDDSVEEVSQVLNGEITSKEYKLKARINKALNKELAYYNFKGLVSIEDVNALYDIVTSKFKEDAEITEVDLQHQAKVYYAQKYAKFKKSIAPITLSDFANIYKLNYPTFL